jgi:quinol monooxygenase YgiN
MIVIHVHVRVLPEAIDSFLTATRANAAASLNEAGIARFDVVQEADDATRFVLVEAYRDADAVLAHKQTVHYATWRDAVAPLMAEPRTSKKYAGVFPADGAW